MSEITENKEQGGEDNKGYLESYIDKPTQNSEEVYSKVEQQALLKGWLPKEQYSGNPDDWIPAHQFVKNGEFRTQYKSVSDELKKMNDKLLSMSREQARIFAQERADDAKKKKREAFEARNVDEMEQYEKIYNQYNAQLESLSQEVPQTQQSTDQKSQQPQIPQEILQFRARNSDWFNSNHPINTAMSTFAAGLYDRLVTDHPEWDIMRRLGEVEIEVKKQFPQEFQNQNRNSAMTVEGKTPPPNKNNLPRYEQLDRQTQNIIDNFVNTGCGLTREDYIKQLKEQGVI